jgi:hypothetical protein
MLVLHFIGLAMAVGAGIAQGIITRMMPSPPMPSPPNAELVKMLGALRNATGVGLIVLWISGPALVWSKYGGFANLSTAFSIKLAFVVLLTITFLIAFFEEWWSGLPKLAPKLGPLTVLFGLGAIVLAVIAFG